jgi:nucleoside-triphosphatase THEP1
MRAAPVGREAAWQRAIGRLQARAAGLVLVVGQPGTGRTHLLRALAEAAPELGYTVIGRDEPLDIDSTMKLNDFRRILTAMTGTDKETSARATPAAGGAIRKMVVNAVETARDERAVFDLLDRAAPAVLLVDGFAPSIRLLTWLVGRLIPHVRGGSGPVIIIVADQPEQLARLRDVADDVIEIGPIDRDAVDRHLREVGAALKLPLSDDEVTAYCDAIAKDIGLLTPLTSVLSVLAQDAGRRPGAAAMVASRSDAGQPDREVANGAH